MGAPNGTGGDAMNIEKANTLLCPFTFNQNPISASSEKCYLCVTTRCIAWEEDGFVLAPHDNSFKIYMGHCKLIPEGK